jgi:hypothetical protein
VAQFFEEGFHGYYEAFEVLREEEKVAFFNLAAQTSRPCTDIVFILGKLVAVGSQSSQPVFERYSAELLLGLGLFEQYMFGAFVLAAIGCAKLGCPLPPWRMGDDTSSRAWEILREMIYVRFGVGDPKEALEALWMRMEAEAILGAADALMLLSQAPGLNTLRLEQSIDLAIALPDRIRNVFEHSLLNLDRLASASKFEDSDHHRLSRARFLVRRLAEFGDEDSICSLERFVRDAEIGADAIAGIKFIKARLVG